MEINKITCVLIMIGLLMRHKQIQMVSKILIKVEFAKCSREKKNTLNLNRKEQIRFRNKFKLSRFNEKISLQPKVESNS